MPYFDRAHTPWNRCNNERMTLGPPSGPLALYSQIAEPVTFLQSGQIKRESGSVLLLIKTASKAYGVITQTCLHMQNMISRYSNDV